MFIAAVQPTQTQTAMPNLMESEIVSALAYPLNI